MSEPHNYQKLLTFVRQIASMEYLDAPILTAQKILKEIESDDKNKEFLRPKKFA